MKRMFVFLIACFLCFSTVTISYAAVPAFDNTQWLELPSGLAVAHIIIHKAPLLLILT